MSDIQIALFVDIILLTVCTVLLLRFGRLSASHATSIYLFFHVYTVTSRLLTVALGSITLFSDWGVQFRPVTHGEIIRAGTFADIALLAVTIASIKASRDDLAKNGPPPMTEEPAPTLSLGHIWRVSAVVFPIGVLSLMALVYLPGLNVASAANLGDWQSSSWITITEIWSGLAVLALIYWYGFRWWLLMPMGVYLFIMAFQGYHRFRVIIPVILLIQIYLNRHKLKWPTLSMVGILLTVMLLFYPLKTIGRLVQSGASIEEISNASTEIVGGALVGENGDQQFLDQLASTVTLVDESGRFYYGGTYAPLITLPIPRQLWPDKPGLADAMKSFSKPWRPMAISGMIMTYIGESYVNFGDIGVILVPFLLTYWLCRIYFRSERSNYYSVARFAYLLVVSSLLQVYRDGLSSLVLFTWVNMMPLMFIVLLHMFVPVKSSEQQVPALAPAGLPGPAVPSA